MKSELWEKASQNKELLEEFSPYHKANQLNRWEFLFRLFCKVSLFWSKKKFDLMRRVLFLKQQGLYDEYISLVKKLGIEVNLATVGNFYYFTILRKHLNSPLSVLEIGAGGGAMALYILDAFNPKYTIVDLPEMLEVSRKTLGNKAFYLKPEEISGKYDLIININSLSEMPHEEVERYFGFINSQKDALFFSVNYQQHNENPLFWNYNDEVLYWQEDKYHVATQGNIGKCPSHSLMRISNIK